jgi:trimethylamine-N-oxide reductase (cytochrome c)
VTEDVRVGVIRLSESGWYIPLEPGQPGPLDKYGDVNSVSLGIGTSELGQGNRGHTILGDVEKFRGTPPEVTVFRAPSGSA